MWEVPFICQFVKIFRGSLNMEPFTPSQFEHEILTPNTSPLIAELVTKLLVKKANKRRALAVGAAESFEVWHEMLTK
jgi:hypothetical protein